MKMKPLLTIALAIVLAGCAGFPAVTGASPLQASGMIEATEVAVAAQQSGQVVEVASSEGGQVRAGDVLFRLDDTLLKAQRQAAAAGLTAAQKGVLTAQAALDAAQTQHDLTLSAALAADQPSRITDWKLAKPTGFDLPLWYFDRDQRAQATQAALDSAQTALNAAHENQTSVESRVGSAQFLEAEKRLSEARVAWQLAQDLLDRTNGATDGQAMRDDAQRIFDSARSELDNAQKAYDDAMTTEGAKDVFDARARVSVAQERVSLAQDALRAFQTGERAPQVTAAAQAVQQASAALEQANALVGQAQAGLDLIDAQMAQLVVRAPLDGVVLTQSIRAGEVLQAGMTALTIGKLDALKVTVYLPEDQYGKVGVGDQADLVSDSFPGETFSARVTRIADQAEYTPQNVQTKEGRQTTVYAVELSLDNASGKLKPGMPVDVTFTPHSTGG